MAKMREGECRTTKKGGRYCMKNGRVHFLKKGASAGKARKSSRKRRK